ISPPMQWLFRIFCDPVKLFWPNSRPWMCWRNSVIRICTRKELEMTKTLVTASALLALGLFASQAQAASHGGMSVMGEDQDVSGGTVTASQINAGANGWLVVHRTDADMKPGPVVGHAPLKAGENNDVAAILTEPVKSGEMLMLMLHSEEGGTKTGIFEYTLGAKEDGPVRVDDKLVMQVITAK
ncbi:MAG: hypothetical protein RIC82_01655, partial [Parvibaculum sp.]